MGTKVSEIQHPVNRRESFVFKAVNSQEVEQQGSLRGPYIFQISFSGKQRNTRIGGRSGALLSTNTVLGCPPTDPPHSVAVWSHPRPPGPFSCSPSPITPLSLCLFLTAGNSHGEKEVIRKPSSGWGVTEPCEVWPNPQSQPRSCRGPLPGRREGALPGLSAAGAELWAPLLLISCLLGPQRRNLLTPNGA